MNERLHDNGNSSLLNVHEKIAIWLINNKSINLGSLNVFVQFQMEISDFDINLNCDAMLSSNFVARRQLLI